MTITGTNFVTGATVTLGGTAATSFSVVNSTTITATTPAHAAGAVSVTVTNPDAQAATLANAFTYVSCGADHQSASRRRPGRRPAAPRVPSPAPTSSPAPPSRIGGTAATGFSVVNSTTITATTPAHAAGAVSVTVTNPDAQAATLASAFTYIAAAPTISGVTPTSGPTAGGTALTITGTNFVGGATVTHRRHRRDGRQRRQQHHDHRHRRRRMPRAR